jgi:hypothetical protein
VLPPSFFVLKANNTQQPDNAAEAGAKDDAVILRL